MVVHIPQNLTGYSTKFIYLEALAGVRFKKVSWLNVERFVLCLCVIIIWVGILALSNHPSCLPQLYLGRVSYHQLVMIDI